MPLTNLTMNLRSPAPVVRAFLLGVATCFLVVTQAHAQPGTLDPSFDPLDGADNTVSAMVTRADGSVVIGGQFTSFNGSPAGGIIQLLPSGQVDPGFVVGSGLNGPVMDMVLQPDGKLIVVGLFTTYDGVATGGGLVRLLSNGSIDPGFVHPFFALAIVSVALHTDGRVVLGGNMGTFTQTRVVQLLPNGAEDPSFNTFLQLNQGVFHVAVFQDDRIMVVGGFTAYGAVPRAGLCVLEPNGSLNGTFDPGTGVSAGVVESVLVTADDKITLGGVFTTYNGNSAVRSIRLNDDGTVDGTYSTGSGFTGGVVLGMALRPDGKLLVAGSFTTFNGTPRSRVCRLNSNGSLDESFDPGTGPDGIVRCLATDPYDRVVLGGEFTSVAGSPRIRVARLNDCTPVIWYADTDEDELGDAGSSTMACEAPGGYVSNADDCNDSDDSIGAATVWYRDLDGDEAGDPTDSIMACEQPPGYVEDAGDCDDNDDTITPSNSCDDGDPYTTSDVLLPYPDCGCLGQTIVVSARVFLEGPYDPMSGMMSDDLRVAGLIPLTEPYTAMSHAPVMPGSAPGGDTMDPAVLTVTGPDAIVDWVILELRAGFSSTERISTRFCLLQRDGDIVESDGVSPVRFPRIPGYLRIAVTHRNHLGIVQYEPGAYNGTYYETTSVDMSAADFPTYGGPDARRQIGGTWVLRAGDTSFCDQVSYLGANNDRDPILVRIGGSVPTNTVPGYFNEDVNMDGIVKYTGSGNDRDPILVTIGGSTPTNIRSNVYLFIVN